MDPERRAHALLRLTTAAGQVQSVAGMVASDRHCVDVVNRIAVAQRALDGAAGIITRNYLERSVTDAVTSGDPLMAAAWNPQNTDEIIATGMQGAQRSSDGGESWTPTQ